MSASHSHVLLLAHTTLLCYSCLQWDESCGALCLIQPPCCCVPLPAPSPMPTPSPSHTRSDASLRTPTQGTDRLGRASADKASSTQQLARSSGDDASFASSNGGVVAGEGGGDGQIVAGRAAGTGRNLWGGSGGRVAEAVPPPRPLGLAGGQACAIPRHPQLSDEELAMKCAARSAFLYARTRFPTPMAQRE